MEASKEEVQAEEEVKKELSANVDQQGIVSIGEGVLFAQYTFNYEVVGGQMSVFEIHVDKRFKVTNVDAVGSAPPVKRWESVALDGSQATMEGSNNNSAKAEDTDKKKKKKKKDKEGESSGGNNLLKVFVEYGMEKYSFMVTAELNLSGTFFLSHFLTNFL